MLARNRQRQSLPPSRCPAATPVIAFQRRSAVTLKLRRVAETSVNPDCLFCKIVAREIPANVVLETDDILAFRDIAPKARVHVLVVSKSHYPNLAAVTEADPDLVATLFGGAVAVADLEGISESGYRMITNTGPDSGMEVPHVHVHVLGGEPLGPLLAR